MTPATRKSLVRKWQRFVRAYERSFDLDDSRSGMCIGDVISEADMEIAIIRTRASYLKALVAAGHLNPYSGPPDDDRLWEMHPVNTEPNGGDLYD